MYFSLALSLAYGALDQGERLNWLESGVIVAMLVTSAFLIVAAIIRRWVSPNPLVNIPFLKYRNTLILVTTLFSFRFVLLAIALLIPAFLGAVQGYRPLETGSVLVWGVVPQLFAGFIAAWLMRRTDSRLILAAGFAIVAVACLMNTQLTSAWAGQNFFTAQLVIGAGLSVTFVGLVGSFVQQAANSGALSTPINVLTYSAFIHTVRIFGGELGTAFMQRFITLREQFHSNLIGLHVEVGNWLTDERLRFLTGGVSTNSAGMDEAQSRSANEDSFRFAITGASELIQGRLLSIDSALYLPSSGEITNLTNPLCFSRVIDTCLTASFALSDFPRTLRRQRLQRV